jgi:RimJ/RimL family protein N-acetyltransferase
LRSEDQRNPDAVAKNVSYVVTDDRVVAFVEHRIGGKVWNPCTAVGLERDGEIVAGAIYERCNGQNVFFHGAANDSRTWASREFLRALVAHPFEVLKVPRMTTVVAASNAQALMFDAGLGFVEECRLRGAAHDGSDSIYLVMWKGDCKWLNSRF